MIKYKIFTEPCKLMLLLAHKPEIYNPCRADLQVILLPFQSSHQQVFSMYKRKAEDTMAESISMHNVLIFYGTMLKLIIVFHNTKEGGGRGDGRGIEREKKRHQELMISVYEISP